MYNITTIINHIDSESRVLKQQHLGQIMYKYISHMITMKILGPLNKLKITYMKLSQKLNSGC